MRIVFMGSPEFALPSLMALFRSYGEEVVAVYTQPDRQSGRGRLSQPPPVKRLALEYGLPVRQPANFRSPEVIEELRNWRADVIVVAAFGQILPKAVIAAPARGILNVHASLLPRWRGAAPIAYSILAGDAETGVTIMEIVPALDAGPMVSKRAIPIRDDDTAGSLGARLAEVGADLLLESLTPWYAGELAAQPQDDARFTYAPPLKKEEGLIDWREPAIQIWRRVRAYNPWPVARAILPSGESLGVLEAEAMSFHSSEAPGTVIVAPKDAMPGGFAVVTGDGILLPKVVQRAGKRPMEAREFLRGQRDFVGARFRPSDGLGE